jgi:hypothetical protein
MFGATFDEVWKDMPEGEQLESKLRDLGVWDNGLSLGE